MLPVAAALVAALMVLVALGANQYSEQAERGWRDDQIAVMRANGDIVVNNMTKPDWAQDPPIADPAEPFAAAQPGLFIVGLTLGVGLVATVALLLLAAIDRAVQRRPVHPYAT